MLEGHTVLLEAAERAAPRDPEAAVLMLADASHICFFCTAELPSAQTG